MHEKLEEEEGLRAMEKFYKLHLYGSDNFQTIWKTYINTELRKIVSKMHITDRISISFR